jgi:hypothetical protein
MNILSKDISTSLIEDSEKSFRGLRAVFVNTRARKIARQRLLYFRRSGLGDDFMVYWSALAARVANLVPCVLRLYFERDETRFYLSQLAQRFPEIEIVDSVGPKERTIRLRNLAPDFQCISIPDLLAAALNRSELLYEPYLHKWLSEYGRQWRSSRRLRLAIALGVLRVWQTPYDEVYDGWQQIGMALGFSTHKTNCLESGLRSAWPFIRKRILGIRSHKEYLYEALLFPGGGSFQDFDDEFVESIKNIVPGLKLARFIHEKKSADVRFAGLHELSNLISQAKVVITNDSLASHLAQFYARRHILICTRSRPGNICFPGAQATRIIDLGKDLRCRPCAYYPLGYVDKCPAGFHRCAGQVNISPSKRQELVEALLSALE